MIYAICVGVALLTSLLALPAIIKISNKKGWFDSIDSRKIHTGEISRLGGVGIFLGFTFSIVAVYFAQSSNLFPEITSFSLLAGGFFLVFLTGLIDDFINIKAIVKFAGQIAAAVLVVLSGVSIKSFIIPFVWIEIPFGFLAPVVTVIWIVSISNAINLVDGMDGLAGGISTIAFLFLGVIALLQGHVFTAIISFALLGSTLGFLRYNFPPAKLFMGDSGALFLGFSLAVIPLLATGSEGTTLNIIPLITLLAIPIMDTLAAILRRVRNKRAIYSPDKHHIHHQFLERNFSTPSILAIIYGITTLMGIAALSWVYLDSYWNLIIMGCSWLAAMIILISTGILDISEEK